MTTNLTKIERQNYVKETLDAAMKCSDEFDCVMVLAIKKDQTQYLATSMMSGHEKAFLTMFLTAWMTKWFRLDDG